MFAIEIRCIKAGWKGEWAIKMLKISAFDLRDEWSPLENLLYYIGLVITFDLITLDCNGEQIIS